MRNFAGQDAMIWWIGQVTDPVKGKWDKSMESYRTKTGEDIYAWRCRVRIVGYHDNAEDLPDEDLPMAHVLVPPGESVTGGQGRTMEYQGGEVVVGFFADGPDCQQPIVFGTLYKQEYLADEVTEGMFNQKNQVDFIPWTSPDIIRRMSPTQINDKSVAQSPVMRTMSVLNKSLTDKAVSTLSDNKIQNRVPCEGNEVGRMKIAMQEFTDKVKALKTIAEFDKHLDPTFGTTFNMQEELKLVTGKIHDASTAVIRRSRSYAVQDTLGKLKTELQDKTPKTLQGATGQASQDLIDVVFCNFEKIQEGLLDYITDSMENLVNQALDVPQCAVENFLGDMFGQVGNILDSQLGNMFGQLGNITGGAIGGMGGMPSDLFDKGLQFADMAQQILECDGIKCPPPTTFSTRNGTFSGVTDDMKGILAKAALRRLPTSEGTSDPCATNITKCGPPKIDIMGGGGKGFNAKAVVNTLGQVIGASIFNAGHGFKRPPALSFVDSCDNGYGSSAYPTIGPVSSINNPSVTVQSAGGVQLYSEDGLIVTAGGNGGIEVTKINGVPITTNQGPLRAGASGGQIVRAGAVGGIQLNDSSCGDITIGGEGGIPLLVGDTPLTLGEFPITCGGVSPIKDNLITLPNGERTDTYWEPGPSGELSSDHWDRNGKYGSGPPCPKPNETSISISKGVPSSRCIKIVNGGQDYGEVFEPGTMGKVVQISPILSAGNNYSTGGTNVVVSNASAGEFSAPGLGAGLTIDFDLVPLPSSIKRLPNGNVAISAGVEFIKDPATGEITKIPSDKPPWPVKTGERLVEEFELTELPPYTGAVQSIRINKQGSGYKAQDLISIPNPAPLNPVIDEDKETTLATFRVISIKPPTGGAVNVPVSGGSGTGMTINYDAIDGVIDTVLVNKPGKGYKIGDVLSVPGGDNTGKITLTCLDTEMISSGVAGGGVGICDHEMKVDDGGVWVPDPHGLELGISDVVVVDPGSSFLPNTVKTTLDNDPTSSTFGQTFTTEVKPNPEESYDGESSYITSLKDVKVKNAGMGYSDGDGVTVSADDGAGGISGTGGAEVELDIVDGFIVNARVTKGGSGFTGLPELKINSDTGVGGRLLPVLKFTKVADAKRKLMEVPSNIKVVTVIDCVQQ